MFTYTFSRREKGLIFGFALILLILAWYVLIYSSSKEEMARIDTEITQTQANIETAKTQVTQLNFMKDVIEQQKAAGVKPKPLPEYDNTEPLMASLNAIMSSATTYSFGFGAINTSKSAYVQRPVSANFSASSYAGVEKILKDLANGPYACILGNTNISPSNGTRADSGPTSCSVSIVFLEKYPEDGSLVSDEEKAAAEAAAAEAAANAAAAA